MEQQYIVNLISAVDASEKGRVAAEVEKRLGMPRAKVEKLLAEPGPITKPVTKAVAERVAQALKGAGVNAQSVPHDWKSVLLLGSEVQSSAGQEEAVYDDSPLETLTNDSPPASPFEGDESAVTLEPSAGAEDAGMVSEQSGAKDVPGEGAPAPSVSYELKDDGASTPESPDEVGGASATSLTDPEPAPTRPASPWRWLAPLLVVLVGLGIVYVIANMGPAASENGAEPLEAQAASEPQDEVAPLEPNEDAQAVQEAEPPTGQAGTESATAVATEVTSGDPEADALAEPEVAPEPDVAEETDSSASLDSAAESDPGAEAPEEAEVDPLAQLLSSAEEGNLDAQLELAERYAVGDGAEQDYAQSALWYERAAAAGDEGAQYELGWFYANGLGVERDLEAATRWYEAAAISGNAEAQYQLGFYRYFGQGGAQDLGEARNLFRAAAEQGVAEARFRLGVMYLEGEGGGVDEAEAERWLRLAREQDVSEVAPYLERIAETAEQRTARADIGAQSSAAPEPLTADRETDPAVTADTGTLLSAAPTALSEIDKAFFELVKTEDAAAIAEAIRAGANVNARDPYGQTPLMYAASHNRPNAIAELIVDLAEVNAQSDAGWTPLMYAARDNPEVLEALLVRGADPTLTNGNGQTALDIAEASDSDAATLLAATLEGIEAPETELPETESVETETSGDLN